MMDGESTVPTQITVAVQSESDVQPTRAERS